MNAYKLADLKNATKGTALFTLLAICTNILINLSFLSFSAKIVIENFLLEKVLSLSDGLFEK